MGRRRWAAERCTACNGLILDGHNYLMDDAHPGVADALTQHSINVIALPYDVPAKLFGGGLRCSHHPLRRDNP